MQSKIFFLSLFFFLFFSCSNNSENYGDLDNPYTDERVDGTDGDVDGTGEDMEDYDYGYGDKRVWKIPYTEKGNLAILPVRVNGMKLDMIFDTGASTTTITLAEAQYLLQKGRLSEDDIIDYQQYSTANGQISIGLRIILRSFTIGNNDDIVMENIEATVVETQDAPLLFGQSVFNLFTNISIDKSNRIIKFVAK